MASPSEPVTCARPSIEPWASSTPGSDSTSASTASGTTRRCSPLSLPIDSVPCTTTSLPAYASLNARANPARIVSPSTSVPARNATPSSTAEQVRSRRRLWAHMPLRLIFHMVVLGSRRSWWGSSCPASAAERLHAVEHGLGSGRLEAVDDATVREEQHGVGIGRGDRVVGDHHDGLALVADGGAQERQH